MKKYASNPILLFALALLLAIISFAVFKIFINQTTSSYAIEISAAFVGALLTIVITAILLNHQTNNELQKEKNVKIYETKLEAYKSLMEKIEEILLKDDLDDKATIQLQIIFQKVAFVAGIDVLNALKQFAKAFAEAARDGRISKEERKRILKEFGMLSVEIRDDLSDHHENNKGQISSIIKENIDNMPLKTTEDIFLGRCSDLERMYFEKIFQYFQSSEIKYEFQTKGLSVKDCNDKSVLWLFPTESNKSIEFKVKDLSPDKISKLKEQLKPHNINSMSFKPSQVPVDTLINMIDAIVN